MSHRFLPALAGMLVFAALVPSTASAGNNAGGRAFLSWDRAGMDSVLTEVPVAPFPLFLNLRDAPDVHALAARIIWTTNTEGAPPCYMLVSASAPDAAPAPDSLGGWAFDSRPGQDFNGDTTYTWTIAFDANDSSKDRIEYRVSGASCADTAHAEFLAARVMVMDALGRIDTLIVTGGVRIAPRIIDLAVEQVSPRRVPVRQATDLSIIGRGFEPGSRVFLQRGGQRIEASHVVVSDLTELMARVVSPFSGDDSLDLVVEHPVGVEASLPSSLRSTGAEQDSFYRPTNDDFAFTQIPLRATTREQNEYLQDPVTHLEWPGWLDGPKLRVIRAPGDTVAIMLSQPYNGIGLQSNHYEASSWVRLHLDPPRLATSLATLVTSGKTFKHESVDFQDGGKPILRVQVNYVDGDSHVTQLVIGTNVRNWISGQMFCGGQVRPFYDTPPADPLGSCAQIYSGPGQTGSPPPTVHYDLQEIPLPASKRAKRIESVEFLAEPVYHVCGNYYDGTSGIFGLAVWPEFKATDAEGDTVSRLSQNTNQSHGGYLFGSEAVGTRRTTDDTACQVASAAMNYSFLGVPCAVDSLNNFLRRSRGYFPEDVAFVSRVSTSGDTIEFRGPALADRINWKQDHTFLVERGRYVHPIATFRILPGEPRRAVVETRHDLSSAVAVGDTGRVYWSMNPTRADRFTRDASGQPRLRTVEIPGSPSLAAKVESLLVRGIPVQVNTHGHMVVADGWVPSFRPDTTARGTYAIQDPLDRRNYRRLIQGKYRNEFKLARYVVAVGGGPGPNALAGLNEAGDEHGLSIVVGHASNVTITDPMGRSIARDPGTGLYSSSIPDAWVIDDIVADHDVDDGLDGPPVMHQFHLPAAVDGHYTVRVDSDGGMAVSVAAFDTGGVVAATAAMDTSQAPSGNSYDVTYSAATSSVAIAWLGPIAVEVRSPVEPRFRVLRNPTSGPVQFEIRSAEDTEADHLEVFDLCGRRVAALDIGSASLRGSVVTWDWRGAGCRAGVYFALQRSRARGVVRFVVLR